MRSENHKEKDVSHEVILLKRLKNKETYEERSSSLHRIQKVVKVSGEKSIKEGRNPGSTVPCPKHRVGGTPYKVYHSGGRVVRDRHGPILR